jgi:hypothetical protein
MRIGHKTEIRFHVLISCYLFIISSMSCCPSPVLFVLFRMATNGKSLHGGPHSHGVSSNGQSSFSMASTMIHEALELSLPRVIINIINEYHIPLPVIVVVTQSHGVWSLNIPPIDSNGHGNGGKGSMALELETWKQLTTSSLNDGQFTSVALNHTITNNSTGDGHADDTIYMGRCDDVIYGIRHSLIQPSIVATSLAHYLPVTSFSTNIFASGDTASSLFSTPPVLTSASLTLSLPLIIISRDGQHVMNVPTATRKSHRKHGMVMIQSRLYSFAVGAYPNNTAEVLDFRDLVISSNVTTRVNELKWKLLPRMNMKYKDVMICSTGVNGSLIYIFENEPPRDKPIPCEVYDTNTNTFTRLLPDVLPPLPPQSSDDLLGVDVPISKPSLLPANQELIKKAAHLVYVNHGTSSSIVFIGGVDATSLTVRFDIATSSFIPLILPLPFGDAAKAAYDGTTYTIPTSSIRVLNDGSIFMIHHQDDAPTHTTTAWLLPVESLIAAITPSTAYNNISTTPSSSMHSKGHAWIRVASAPLLIQNIIGMLAA